MLVDGPGADALSGGEGADLFVLVRDGAPDRITDFEPGLDTFDLTAWGRAYAVEAVEITPTADGAVLAFAGETLTLVTAGRRSLSAADFTAFGLFPLSRALGEDVVAGLWITGTAGADTQMGGAGDDVLADRQGRTGWMAGAASTLPIMRRRWAGSASTCWCRA